MCTDYNGGGRRYRIEHKIWSVAKIYDPVEYREFTFARFGSDKGAWLATAEFVGQNGNEALTQFYSAIIPLIDRIAYFRHSAMSLAGASWRIYRLDDNEEGIFVFRARTATKPHGLILNEWNVRDLDSLDSVDLRLPLYYMREAMNCDRATTRLQALCSGIEALAGEVHKPKKCSKCQVLLQCDGCKSEQGEVKTTNNKRLRKLLGKSVYGGLYGEHGLRHRINHGLRHTPDEAAIGCEAVYQALKVEIDSMASVTHDNEPQDIPRTWSRIFEVTAYAKVRENAEMPNLVDLEVGPDQIPHTIELVYGFDDY